MSGKSNHSVTGRALVAFVKKSIAEHRHRIRFHDLAMEKNERLLQALSEESFLKDASGMEAFSSKMLEKYRMLVQDPGIIITVTAFWGEGGQHEKILELPFSRLAEALLRGGPGSMPAKHWYPIFLLFYLAGVSATTSKNYKMLSALFHATANYGGSEPQGGRRSTLLKVIGDGTVPLEMVGGFCDGAEPDFPLSEKKRNKYFFEALSPILHAAGVVPSDDGDAFEHSFDRFELFQEIGHYQLTQALGEGCILFAGRYSDKSHRSVRNLYSGLLNEVRNEGENWPPLKSGLFKGCAEDVMGVIGALAALHSRNGP